MINLFEYQNKVDVDESLLELDGFLDEIWRNRETNSYYSKNREGQIEKQRFIQILHSTGQLKSNKYVGVIHCNDLRINLLPKVFFEVDKEYSEKSVSQIQKHILWWLSYCRKIEFPNYQTTLGEQSGDFFEVLIYLFSKYTRELLNASLYQKYEEISKELPYIKGRLNTGKYINENISRGNWHKLNCTYDSFVFDNQFNRIVKYVAVLLFGVTKQQDNKKKLREILFILDEVSDQRCSVKDCERISFSPIFQQFKIVLDYCKLFLSNSITFDYKNDLQLFAFLLPMEYVFEDFIFGFIDKEIAEVSAKAQRSNVYLDRKSIFKLKPDLFLQAPGRSLIADAKYKIIQPSLSDLKFGVSQNDLYQMLAYAVRFKIDEIVLFYPNCIGQQEELHTEFVIKDEFTENCEIAIRVYQLPIIDRTLLEMDLETERSLHDCFESATAKLRASLRNILC